MVPAAAGERPTRHRPSRSRSWHASARFLAGAFARQYAAGVVECGIGIRGAPNVKQAGKQAAGDATRPTTNENYLLISAFARPDQSPLVAVSKRISDSGCNLVEARVAALGAELSVVTLAQGSWDAIAKLETALGRIEREHEVRITHFRTGPKPLQTELLPYVVEVVAADKPGVLFQLADFFARQGIAIEQLQSTRYRAMQTGADMFSAQITVGIPNTMHIAGLRDDFLEFCDGLNLDAIMDPMKF
jgi:glycine cleavage system transcriptional repressor